MRFVFFVGVLRIENEEVAAFQKVDQFDPSRPGPAFNSSRPNESEFSE